MKHWGKNRTNEFIMFIDIFLAKTPIDYTKHQIIKDYGP